MLSSISVQQVRVTQLYTHETSVISFKLYHWHLEISAVTIQHMANMLPSRRGFWTRRPLWRHQSTIGRSSRAIKLLSNGSRIVSKRSQSSL